MKLEPVSNDDLELYVSMFCSEQHMADLGGVQPLEKIPSILEKQIGFMTSGKGWLYKFVPEHEDLEGIILTLEEVSKGVGTVSIWQGDWKDQPVTEMGWGIAPPFQGNKFAKKAVTLLLDMAVADGRWGTIHVFTSTTNIASVALCKSCGFEYQGEETVDYDGRDLVTYHYTYESVKG